MDTNYKGATTNGLNFIKATQTVLSRTCDGLCRKHLVMLRWFVFVTFMICVGDFHRNLIIWWFVTVCVRNFRDFCSWLPHVKVGVMEFGLKATRSALHRRTIGLSMHYRTVVCVDEVSSEWQWVIKLQLGFDLNQSNNLLSTDPTADFHSSLSPAGFHSSLSTTGIHVRLSATGIHCGLRTTGIQSSLSTDVHFRLRRLEFDAAPSTGTSSWWKW